MSDKGRDMSDTLCERCERWIGVEGEQDAQYPFCASCATVLRSHGWLHEEDVVEGKHWCDEDEPEAHCMNHGRYGCDNCNKTRPATIKDLIGRE
jgi:hypothetical protein